MTDDGMTTQDKITRAHTDMQAQVDRVRARTNCPVCAEAYRYSQDSGTVSEARGVLAGLVGKVITPDDIDGIVGAVQLAEEDADRAWVTVMEMELELDEYETRDVGK
jgi:hypothetical protein